MIKTRVLSLFRCSFVVASFGGSEVGDLQSKVCVTQNGYWKSTGSYTNVHKYDVVEVNS